MEGTDSLAVKAKQTYGHYREAAGIYHLAPMLLVVIVLLTHFTVGSSLITEKLSYADLMCFTGIFVSVSIIIAGHAAQRFSEPRTAVRLVAAATTLAAGVFLASQLAPSGIRPFMLTASAITEGAFIVVVGAYWFDYFSDEPMETILITLAICLIGGCAISWFLLGVSPTRYTVGNLLLIAGAGFTLAKALNETEIARTKTRSPEAGTTESTSRGSAASLLLAIFMLSMASMFTLSIIGRHLWHGNDVWLVIAPTALVVLVAVLFFEHAETGTLLWVALLLGVAGVLMAAFLDVSPTVMLIIATNGLTITVSSSIAFMLNLAKGSQNTPHDAGALLVAVTFAGCMAGRTASEIAVADAGGNVSTGIAIALTVALIACTLTSMSSRSTKGLVRKRLRKEKDEIEQKDAHRKAIQALAQEKGLGAREAEALELLLEGCSAKEVAARMFVADGTAKAHIRHVYRKLDVHDRDTLFETVSEYVSEHQD